MLDGVKQCGLKVHCLMEVGFDHSFYFLIGGKEGVEGLGRWWNWLVTFFKMRFSIERTMDIFEERMKE